MRYFGLPYRKIIIDSNCSIDDFKDRLQQVTTNRHKLFKDLTKKYKFIGKIDNDTFRIMPTIKGRDSYLPLIIGKLISTKNGFRIKAKITIHPSVIIIMISLLIFFELLWISKNGELNFYLILGFLLFHSIMYIISFIPLSDEAIISLKDLTKY
jgi:hypothetical protein